MLDFQKQFGAGVGTGNHSDMLQHCTMNMVSSNRT
jgi:hypothetical protein